MEPGRLIDRPAPRREFRAARRRWRAWLGIGLGVAMVAGLGAWHLLLWRIEHVPSATTVASVTCPGALDPAWQTAVERARPHLQAMLTDLRIPGLSVAVAADGELVWSEGFGYADPAVRAPACPEMSFRAQSVSKPLTAALLLRLHERNQLDLDAPVRRWLPQLHGTIAEVTPRQLASHRAGVRHYHDDLESVDTTRYATSSASIVRFASDSLRFDPGSDFFYSSFGYVLLGAVLEQASGLPFPALLERELARPLALAGTRAELGTERPPQRVAFYDHVTPYSLDGSVVPSPPISMSGKWPGGGLLTTAPDLVRFASALLDPRTPFLGRASVAAMLAPAHALVPGFGYGLGWMAAHDPHLRRVRFHFGAGSGGTSVLALYPDQRVAIAMLANLGHAGFPPARLLGVANAFVPSRVWLATMLLLLLALTFAVAGLRDLRRLYDRAA